VSREDQRSKAAAGPDLPDPPAPNALLTGFRALSGPAFILGGWGVISTSFWIGVFAIYFGFLLLFLEIVFEPWILRNSSLFVHCALMALCLAPVGWFMISIVFVPARLDFNAYAISVPHFNGDVLGGIKWTEKQNDLRVWIRNQTTAPYEKVDMVVDTNAYIVAAGQLQTIPMCTVGLSNGVDAHVTITAPNGQQHLVTTPVGSSLGIGYRVVCDKLPPLSAIELILATSVDHSDNQGLVVDAVQTPNLGIGKPRPTVVTVKGVYTSAFRARHIYVTLDVAVE
jgi:hypothetical protein